MDTLPARSRLFENDWLGLSTRFASDDMQMLLHAEAAAFAQAAREAEEFSRWLHQAGRVMAS